MNMKTFKKENDKHIGRINSEKHTPSAHFQYDGNQKPVLRASDSIKKVVAN